MQQELTMGSLFSGSGGFELASAIFGIEPRWASEIEPLPMLITKKNFPDMPHHGDIRYMNGGKVEAVTVIAGGSAVAIPEIMMVQPMDWESENREHLPIHSQQPTAMQSHTQSTGQHSIKE